MAIAKQNLKQRAGIVRKSADVCLALIELEQAEVVLVSVTATHMQAAGKQSTSTFQVSELGRQGSESACYLQEHMTTAYENKTPKVVIAALDIVAECLRCALPNLCTSVR